MENKTLNQKTLAVLAPLLILTGIAGFLIPERYTMMSGAAPYNLFHIIFGVAGLWLVMTNSDLWASICNFVFGLIDLYQALASVVGLTPIQYSTGLMLTTWSMCCWASRSYSSAAMDCATGRRNTHERNSTDV